MSKAERIHIRITEDEKVAFEEAAAYDELKLSEWLRQLGTRRVTEIRHETTTPAGNGFVPGAGIT